MPTPETPESAEPPEPLESTGVGWWSRWRWIVRIVAISGLAVVVWACATGWGAIVHGQPVYAILLALTVVGCLAIGLRTLRRTPRRRLLAGRILLAVLAVAWIATMAWLRPFPAVQPALDALRPDAAVAVTETPTRIVLAPRHDASKLGVFFQPGARVDARAYAAVLQPLAEAGYTVVIDKQPLGIAFLAVDDFAGAANDFPRIREWIVGGHSLGGTVAAMEADAHDHGSPRVVGLMLFASYPANDLHRSLTAKVLSVSGSRDGLATPQSIAASAADLPASTSFVVIRGGVHAFFGDYGPQPGDGTPTIPHADARVQISAAALNFAQSISN